MLNKAVGKENNAVENIHRLKNDGAKRAAVHPSAYAVDAGEMGVGREVRDLPTPWHKRCYVDINGSTEESTEEQGTGRLGNLCTRRCHRFEGRWCDTMCETKIPNCTS